MHPTKPGESGNVNLLFYLLWFYPPTEYHIRYLYLNEEARITSSASPPHWNNITFYPFSDPSHLSFQCPS
jgi:hypothetical protein